jgi:non-specific protein-tyrosine kinase
VVPAPAPSPAEKILPRDRILSFCHDEQVAEQIRKLRSHLGVRLEKTGGRSLLVTSSGAREGKTFIALHLALDLAREAGKATVLVDADLQGASLSARLGVGEREGLSDVLQGRMAPTRAVLASGLPGLELLPAGRRVREPSTLLSTCALREAFVTLAARYPDALLLFDGPALGNGAGALLLSGFVDGVLLVTEAERSSARSVREAVEALSHRNLLGTVLNRTRG